MAGRRTEARRSSPARLRHEWYFPCPMAHPSTTTAFPTMVGDRSLRPAGLRYRKPHTVPHTFAGLLIEAGNPSSTCRSSSGTTPRPSLWLSLGTCCPEGTGAVDRWTTRQSAILAQPTTARPKQLLVDPSRYPRGI